MSPSAVQRSKAPHSQMVAAIAPALERREPAITLEELERRLGLDD